MKLLFDENLSRHLVAALVSVFPDSDHVALIGLAGATDEVIWSYAREHGFALISKDDDFRSLSLVRGAPPKVIWLRVGNAPTSQVEGLIRSNLESIAIFANSAWESLLILTSRQ